MRAPLLQAKALRIALDGAVAGETLDLESRGDFVCLVGNTALSALLLKPLSDGQPGAPKPHVLAGELQLEGKPVAQAVKAAALVAGTMPLPAKASVSEYLCWNAQLAGVSPKQAKLKVNMLLSQLHLERWQQRLLHHLGRLEGRVVALLAAFVTGRSPLVWDAAFSELGSQEADFLASLVQPLLKHRRTVLAMPTLPTTAAARSLLEAASDVFVFRQGALLVHSEGSQFEGVLDWMELRLLEPNPQLRARLTELGAGVSGTDTRMVVRLPPDVAASDLMRLAQEAQAIVTALVPLVA